MINPGDDVLILITRDDLPDADYKGKTGRVLAVQRGTGDLLLKFKGKAWPVSFPASFCAVRSGSRP